MNERLIAIIEKIVEKFGTSNPFAIADQNNLEIRYVPYLQNPLGQYVRIRGRRMILLSDCLSGMDRRYFVAAHELYHALEHEELAGYYISTDLHRGKLETEANKFATYLMIALYEEENGRLLYSFSDICKKYGVEEEFGDYFIDSLNLRRNFS